MKNCSKWTKDEVDELNLDEEIQNYWYALDIQDRTWSIREEENNRKTFARVLTTEELKRAKAAQKELTKKRSTDSLEVVHKLQGVHNYDILANPNYYEAFAYIPCIMKNRAQLIIDSESDDEKTEHKETQCNLTRVALNLGFIEPKSVQEFNFSKDQMLTVTEERLEEVKTLEAEKKAQQQKE